MTSSKTPLLLNFNSEVQFFIPKNYGTNESSVIQFTNNTEESNDKKENTLRGTLFAVLAGVSFTSCNAMIKTINVPDTGVSSWQILVLRCIIQIIFLTPVILYKQHNIFSFQNLTTKIKVFSQAFFGGGMLFCVFESINRLPIGDFSAIAFSSPVFTMILSTFLLKEKCGLYRISVALLLMSGVLVLTRPTMIFGKHNLSLSVNGTNEVEEDIHEPEVGMVGIVFAVSTAILSAMISIIARRTRDVPTSVLLIWLGAGGLSVSLIGLFCLDSVKTPFHWSPVTWSLAIAQAVLGLNGINCLYKAITYTSPTRVMVIRSFEIVCSYILQVTLFGMTAHSLDFIGAVMIVLAVFSIGLENYIKNKIECCNNKFM